MLQNKPSASVSHIYLIFVDRKCKLIEMNDSSDIYQQVNNHYGTLAQGAEPLYSSTIAKAFGYTQEQLNSIPAEANLGVSCGNPLAIASLHEVGLPMLQHGFEFINSSA